MPKSALSVVPAHPLESKESLMAFLYSLVESCKAMDINVEDYLTWLFLNGNRVKDGDRNGWRKMLPGQSDIYQGGLYRERLRTACQKERTLRAQR